MTIFIKYSTIGWLVKRSSCVPSSRHVRHNGEDLREMNRLLLEKVEELTLYLLQLEEQMNFLKTKKN